MRFSFAAVAAVAALSTVSAQTDGIDFFGCNAANSLALTFDDGPNPNITPALLDTLKELKIKTTFFVLGQNVADNKAILKRAYDEGHQIAHHTYDHLSMPTLTDAQVRDQMQRNEDLVFSVIGRRTAIMRPPYGDSDSRVYNIVKSMGYSLVKWNLDSNDWQGIDPFLVFNNDLKPGKGYMSLQHDINPQEIPAKIRQIYNLVRSRGFKFVSISECIGKQPYKDGWGNVVNAAFDNGGPAASNPPAGQGTTSAPVAATTGAPTATLVGTVATTTTTTTVGATLLQTTAARTTAPTASPTGAAAIGSAASLPVVSALSFFAALAAFAF